jgi:8-oxo-dGTP diphosphatase
MSWRLMHFALLGGEQGASRDVAMNTKNRTYPERPIVAVAAVVFKGGDVLLVSRGQEPRMGEWGLPGGAQELDETVFEGARREVMEETGVDIEVIGLVDIVDSIRRDADGRPEYHYTIIETMAEWISGEPTAADDAAAAGWFSMEEALKAVRWSKTVEIIEKAALLRRSLNR